MQCAYCRSRNTVKNGINMIGKQKYKCSSCGRQFVLSPAKFPIPDQTKSLIDRLLLERISLAGIARITGVSERWLQTHVNQKYERTPRHVQVKKRAVDGWPSSVTNCGRSFKTAIINSGFGWRSTAIPARSSGSMSGIAAGKALKPSGRLCHPFIGNARSVIPIFGRLTKP